MAETPKTNKPDFRNGFPIRDLLDGSMILGQADGEELVLSRRGDEFFAIGAHCTHYGGPLGEGLIVGDTVRCPWHHACFSLRNGEALRAPALVPPQETSLPGKCELPPLHNQRRRHAHHASPKLAKTHGHALAGGWLGRRKPNCFSSASAFC